MAVEFALRPRISLERPPRRRRVRFRLPPLAFPIAAYWLTIAGVTYGVIRGAEGASTQPEAVREPIEERSLFEAPTPPEPPKQRLEPEPAQADVPVQTPAPLVAEREPETPRLPEPRNDEAAVVAPPASPPKENPRNARLEPREVREVREPEPKRSIAPAPFELAIPRTELQPAPATERVALAPEPSTPPPSSVGLPSCESAAESARETLEIGRSRGAPDLSRDAFASVLENGAYLGRCAIPERTALEICAAVQDGKVVGITVRAEPQNSTISNCVRRAVAGLRFPRNSRLDVTRTRFEAVR